MLPGATYSPASGNSIIPHTVLDPLQTVLSFEPAALLAHIPGILQEGFCTVRATW